MNVHGFEEVSFVINVFFEMCVFMFDVLRKLICKKICLIVCHLYMHIDTAKLYMAIFHTQFTNTFFLTTLLNLICAFLQ